MKGTHKPSLAYSRAMDSVNVASDDGMTRELLEQAEREVEAEIAANRREAERRAAESLCESCGCPLSMHHIDRGSGFNDLGSGERVCPSKERRYEWRREENAE